LPFFWVLFVFQDLGPFPLFFFLSFCCMFSFNKVWQGFIIIVALFRTLTKS
jgi:hypothetical protein